VWTAQRRRALALGVALACLMTASPARVVALNPTLQVNQYSHTVWKVRDGFAKGAIKSITQTPDGYLWLGTDFGLLRFDGVRAVLWQPPPDQPLPSNDIWSLLAARDGALWVGTAKGVARWKDGRLTVYSELAGRIIWRLLEDRQSTVWVSAAAVPAGRLCAIRDRDVTCVGDDGSLGYGVTALYEDRNGSIWLGVADGIWRWTPGPPRFFAMSGEQDSIQAFGEDDDGALLVDTRHGVRRFVDGRAESYPRSGPHTPVNANRLLRDRDGALWIATASGIVHARDGKTDRFTRADGLSGDDVRAIFEDREGGIWVGTESGLDRFRDVIVAAVTSKQGLSNPRGHSVRVAADRTLWVATPDSLEKWDNGQFTSYRARARSPAVDNARQVVVKGFPEGGVNTFFPDDRGRIWTAVSTLIGYLERDRFIVRPEVHARQVRSIAQDSEGTVWFADQRAGLIGVTANDNVAQIPWTALGRKDFATVMVADPVRGGLWLGFWDGGIGHVENGQLRETHSTADGLGEGRITNLRLASDASLWVGTQGGLSRLRQGTVTTLTRKNGFPCDSLNWVIPDDAGALWLDTPCGLVRIARDQVDAWIADPTHAIEPTVFDSTDGVSLQAGFAHGYEPFVAKSRDGRLWFVSVNGLNVVDPRRVSSNQLPPPVHVERIVANRTPFDVSPGGSRVHLPPLTTDLQIDYTALSLLAPEKVRFRYLLEGYDRDWQDAGNRRQAFYTNLPPRDYRFRVTASNNSGVWNQAGASVDFSVAPAYYQTTWFKACSIATVIALVWAGHRVRLRIVEKHEREISALNERLMKAQEQERIRIAGELHDGVMQDMLSVTMMLGSAKRRMPDNSEAKATIDKAQHKLVQAGTDLRQLSHDLHPPLLQDAGLPGAVNAYCEQFSTTWGIPVSCNADERVGDLSRGAALALFRILQEALGNAAKHAAAKRITVRLTRSESDVSLTVSDDGVGFDRTQLASGGGLGLVMMRERASQLNGTFEFESAPKRGTTIRVVVPFRR
jgi:signal transduction histidine kinase/ligand-binding sensor domain-containing protein